MHQAQGRLRIPIACLFEISIFDAFQVISFKDRGVVLPSAPHPWNCNSTSKSVNYRIVELITLKELENGWRTRHFNETISCRT
jgi:hypothetical protein